jgi:hypothetical protein
LILATGVAAVVLSTPATGLAQVGRVGPAEVLRRAERDEQQSRGGLSNQLRPFYRFELMHARTACGLGKEELQKLRPDADAAYQQAINRLDAARRSGLEPDYHEVIRDAVFSVLERHVSPERMAALRADLHLREAARKEAAVDMLVAVLDRQLLLTERQRRQIVDSLSAGWDDRWCDAVEVATGGNVVIPNVPDRLVTPFLSDAQRETWSHLTRQWGRLWAVNIDHGDDLAVDQDLGAGLPPRIVAVAPRLLARRRAVVLAEVQFRRALDQPLIVVLDEDRVQPAGRDEDGDLDRAALLRRRQQALLERRRAALLQAFDGYVFGFGQTEEEMRRQLETELARRVDHLDRACDLSDLQKKKLQAAGRGDIKHFFDRVAEARREFQSVGDGRPPAIADVCRPLAEEREALLNASGPIFAKSLARVLAEDGRAAPGKDVPERRAFRHRAAVRWTAVLLARSLGMVDDQRRRLESMLLEEVHLPRKSASFDYWVVMYQVSRVPEARIRPILDDVQWRLLTKEFNAARQWQRHLEKGGFLPREIGDNHRF